MERTEGGRQPFARPTRSHRPCYYPGGIRRRWEKNAGALGRIHILPARGGSRRAGDSKEARWGLKTNCRMRKFTDFTSAGNITDLVRGGLEGLGNAVWRGLELWWIFPFLSGLLGPTWWPGDNNGGLGTIMSALGIEPTRLDSLIVNCWAELRAQLLCRRKRQRDCGHQCGDPHATSHKTPNIACPRPQARDNVAPMQVICEAHSKSCHIVVKPLATSSWWVT